MSEELDTKARQALAATYLFDSVVRVLEATGWYRVEAGISKSSQWYWWSNDNLPDTGTCSIYVALYHELRRQCGINP